MKIARLKCQEETDSPDDVQRLTKVMESYGILIPATDIIGAWVKHSKKNSSEWLPLPEKDEDIYLNIIDFLVVTNW